MCAPPHPRNKGGHSRSKTGPKLSTGAPCTISVGSRSPLGDCFSLYVWAKKWPFWAQKLAIFHAPTADQTGGAKLCHLGLPMGENGPKIAKLRSFYYPKGFRVMDQMCMVYPPKRAHIPTGTFPSFLGLWGYKMAFFGPVVRPQWPKKGQPVKEGLSGQKLVQHVPNICVRPLLRAEKWPFWGSCAVGGLGILVPHTAPSLASIGS